MSLKVELQYVQAKIQKAQSKMKSQQNGKNDDPTQPYLHQLATRGSHPIQLQSSRTMQKLEALINMYKELYDALSEMSS